MRSARAGPASTSRNRRPAPLLLAAGWLVVVPLAAAAAARLVAWDARAVLVGLNALTPVLYLPAWVVTAGAVVGRRWALAGAGATVVVAHLSFALPEVLAAEPLPAAARAAPAFRVFSGNVFAGNADAEAYAAEICRHAPDLVLLQEATPPLLARLEAAGAFAGLPHRATVARRDPFAAAVLSRWPLEDRDVLSVRERPVLVRATITPAPGRPVRVFAFHAVSPVGGGRDEWIADLRAVRDAVLAAVEAERRPVLLAGDFNATWGHRHFRAILDAGLTDAAVARGHPYRMTWPLGAGLVPPLLRIDHVLTTAGLAVTSIETGAGPGSDHRPLIADVAVLR